MSKTIEQIEQELDAKIPRSAVEERDGGGGRRLSYLSGHYVIDRLNKVFGPLNWSNEILEVKEVVNKTPRGEFPAYLVKVRLIVEASGQPQKISTAYGYGCDKGPLNAHELAIKEAITDGIKVAAKNLGMSMGLALYSKEQENVDDEETNTERSRPVVPKPVPVGSGASKEETKGPGNEVLEKHAKSEGAAETSSDSIKDAASKTRTLIRSYVSAAIKKGVLTMPEMKEYLSINYGAEILDKVPDDRLPLVLNHVKGLTT